MFYQIRKTGMITFPFWFKIFLGCFGMLIITGTIRLLFKNKFIDSINKLSAEKKDKLIKTNSFLVKILKVFLLALPLNLILIPYLFYTYSPENFFHIFVMMVVVYVLVTEELLFRRSIIIKLNMAN